MFIEVAHTAGDIAMSGGVGASLALILRETVPIIVARFNRNGNKPKTAGELAPSHWESKFDHLGEAMHLLAKNQETGNDILNGIRTDLKIVMDRIPR